MARSAWLLVILFCLPVFAVPGGAQIGTLLQCPPSTLLAGSTPEQVHISLTDDPSVASVAWATPGQTGSEVEYGPEGDLSQSASGSEECYNHDMVFHSAEMVGLLANTNYSYRVGDGSVWSLEFMFHTPDPQSDLKVLAFGDHGMSTEGDATTSYIEESSADLLILSGDISYANGDQSVWDDYLRQNEEAMTGLPWMMVPGNHENESGFDFDAFETRFVMTTDSASEFWNTFVIGPVRFVGFSTEHPWDSGSAQRAWLENTFDQAREQRDEVPWLVVYGHKPMYTSHGDDTHDKEGELRAELEGLFVDSGIDLVIWGHDHFYERSWPVEYGNITSTGRDGLGAEFSADDSGPIHIIAGTAGRGSYDYASEQPEWSFHREKSYGLLELVINNGSLNVDYVRQDGSVGDSFSILQTDPFSSTEEVQGMPGPGLILSLAAIAIAAIRRPLVS